MRESIVLNKLRAGERVFSIKSNFSCSRPVEMAGIAGFDCFWACREHVPNDWQVLERQILAAKAYGMDTMVRVARGSYSELIKPLELDASGILIPHVMSADEARDLVRQVRFHPIGRRPVDGGNADGQFGMTPFAEYAEFVNRNRFVFVQIEDPEAVPYIGEIAAVPGIDGLFFGPGDYSHAIGKPGRLDHPEVDRVRRMVVAEAHRHGKFAVTVATVQNFRKYIEYGFDMLNMGSDLAGIRAYFAQVMEEVAPYREPRSAACEPRLPEPVAVAD